MRLDTETLVAALLHDTVEDTSATLDEVRAEFGEEVASLVDGVTKLTGITFQSRDEAQAENYRKMVVAMASDIRVILIKLADRCTTCARSARCRRTSRSTRRRRPSRSSPRSRTASASTR
jgi:(p)ppGpp synthase/HD superfamily hydrolase